LQPGSGDYSEEEGDGDTTPPGGSGGSGGGRRGHGGRSARQQSLNKEAQKRYRCAFDAVSGLWVCAEKTTEKRKTDNCSAWPLGAPAERRQGGSEALPVSRPFLDIF